MCNYAISLESDHWVPGTWSVTDGNTDVFVELENGSNWVATFFTYANITSLTQKNRATGECSSGQYFWASDMILVDEISRERIEEIVAYLLEEEEFEFVFKQIEADQK